MDAKMAAGKREKRRRTERDGITIIPTDRDVIRTEMGRREIEVRRRCLLNLNSLRPLLSRPSACRHGGVQLYTRKRGTYKKIETWEKEIQLQDIYVLPV